MSNPQPTRHQQPKGDHAKKPLVRPELPAGVQGQDAAAPQPGPGAPGYGLYKPAMPQRQQVQEEHGTPTHWDDLPKCPG